MSPSDPENPNEKRNSKASETEDVFDSVFGIFMDLAVKAETVVTKQQTRRLITSSPNKVHDDEEHEGFKNDTMVFNNHSLSTKEYVLTEMCSRIMKNMLEMIPEEGTEAFLVRCFNGIYQKLPEESRKLTDRHMKEVEWTSKITGWAPEVRSKNSNDHASQTEEVLDSVFYIFMDFADKVETIVSKQQTRLTAPALNRVHDEKHQGFDNAREAFNKMSRVGKEMVLDELWKKIVRNLLAMLPEEGKETSLVKCFDGIYQNLSEEFRKEIDILVSMRTLDLMGVLPPVEAGDGVSSRTKVRYPSQVGRPPQPNLPLPPPPHPQPNPPLPPPHG